VYFKKEIEKDPPSPTFFSFVDTMSKKQNNKHENLYLQKTIVPKKTNHFLNCKIEKSNIIINNNKTEISNLIFTYFSIELNLEI